MVLCSQRFLVFVEYAGVKDRFDALVDEPLYMACLLYTSDAADE